jgi:nitroreductase
MDAIEAILTRRSVRKYTSAPVPNEAIEKILTAAMYAPSAGNEQPWHFVVIRDREVLDKIPDIHPYASMVFMASVAIVVCGDVSLEKNTGFWAQDCSAATQNLLVAANAIGLGTVWVGIYPVADRVHEFRKLLNLPETVFPFALIPVGYPDGKAPEQKRFDATRIHHNRWLA